jgi:integrase/recombinase XerD
MDKKSDAKIIAEFINFQKKQGNSEGTLKLYTQIINEFSKWLEMDGSCLDSLTRLDIQQYVNYLSSKGISASTIENKFAAISCLAKSLGQTNILQNIRKPKFRKNYNIAPKSLERNDRNKILREIERSKNLRNIAITYLFLYTGIRVSELVALDRPDLISGERSGSVLVRKGKGNIERKVPLPAEARLHLKNYLNSRDDSYKELFLSNYKKRISIRSVQRIFEKYDIHPHQLRHTYCRELVGSGIDIVIVAELAGHSDINTTRRYSKPSVIELEDAIEKAFH